MSCNCKKNVICDECIKVKDDCAVIEHTPPVMVDACDTANSAYVSSVITPGTTNYCHPCFENLPKINQMRPVGLGGEGDKCLYELAGGSKGFLFHDGTNVSVSSNICVPVPELFSYVKDEFGEYVTNEGGEFLKVPPPFPYLMTVTEDGCWRVIQGPTDECKNLVWDGSKFIFIPKVTTTVPLSPDLGEEGSGYYIKENDSWPIVEGDQIETGTVTLDEPIPDGVFRVLLICRVYLRHRDLTPDNSFIRQWTWINGKHMGAPLGTDVSTDGKVNYKSFSETSIIEVTPGDTTIDWEQRLRIELRFPGDPQYLPENVFTTTIIDVLQYIS